MANHTGNTVSGTGDRPTRILPASKYATFLSDAAKSRRPSPIRSLYPLEDRPGMISLLAGKPNAATFPFTALQFSVRDPANPDGPETTLSLPPEHLAQGLQYGPTAGFPPLIRWFTELQCREHKRAEGEGWRVNVGIGSQDLIYKAVNAILNPGESMLVESPVYAGVLPMFHSLDCEQIEVETDAHGICSSSLRSILESWPTGKPKPKVLYTVPYGCNPSGMTATLERRLEVLALSREHDFIILEDDPYYYLYFGAAPRPPSYFTLEGSEPGSEIGRVLRFDSLSKILSGGLRIGFATGPKPLLDAMDMHTATSNLQTPGLTQSITYTLLSHWGATGFDQHTARVAAFYQHKRDVFEAALQRHLTGLAEWTTPEAGMFFWFKLLLGPHSDNSDTGADEGDSAAVIRTRAVEHGVLALPGTVFLPDGRRSAYVRIAFSGSTEEEVDEACRRLRAVVLEARAAAAATAHVG